MSVVQDEPVCADALVQTRLENGVATLLLNRPQVRNALSPDMTDALIAAFRHVDADPAVKCIVITGAGEHFSAGGDVKGFGEALALSPQERHDQFEKRLLVASRLPNLLLRSRTPVIVAPRGAVAGAGLALCLAADITLACQSSFYIAAHVHVGLSLDVGLSRLLVETIGIKAAKRLALLGDRIDAAQALSLGLVDELVAPEDFDARLEALARRLAVGPALAMEGTRTLLNAAAYSGLDGQLAEEGRWIARCVAHGDFAEGVGAAAQRRKPAFA